jgi:hypothetical protein
VRSGPDNLKGHKVGMRVRPRDRLALCFKKSLRDFQYDPVHWMELALAYAIIGKEEKADKAVALALGLAPNDRFVLRCASRFLVHHHQPEQAEEILRRADRTPLDPWLLAAHVAISEIIKKPSRFYRKAKETLNSSALPAFHLIGTRSRASYSRTVFRE